MKREAIDASGSGLGGTPSFAAERAPKSRPDPSAWSELDLRVEVTKLALSIANRFIGDQFGLRQPHHLVRLLVSHARAVTGQRVAVATVRVRSSVAQPR